ANSPARVLPDPALIAAIPNLGCAFDDHEPGKARQPHPAWNPVRLWRRWHAKQFGIRLGPKQPGQNEQDSKCHYESTGADDVVPIADCFYPVVRASPYENSGPSKIRQQDQKQTSCDQVETPEEGQSPQFTEEN